MHGFFHRQADPTLSSPQCSVMTMVAQLSLFLYALRLFWYYLQSRFTGSEDRLLMCGPVVVFVHVEGGDTHEE